MLGLGEWFCPNMLERVRSCEFLDLEVVVLESITPFPKLVYSSRFVTLENCWIRWGRLIETLT